MAMGKDIVTIDSEKYLQLLKDSCMLQCLEAVDVNNWEGYSFAYTEFLKQFPEE